MQEIHFSVTDNDKDAPPYDIRDDLNGQATLKDLAVFSQRALWQIGEAVLEEEQAKGFDKKPRVRTDNKWGKDPRMVKPFGKIEYFSRLNISEAIVDAYIMIMRRSPIRTGQYRASHYVYLNGRKIAESLEQLRAWMKVNEGKIQGNDILRIVNVTPYAARIEVRGIRRAISGKNKGTNIKKISKNSVGSGTYFLAARSIASKYKAAGSIKASLMPNGFGGVRVLPTGKFRTSYIPDKLNKKRRKRYSGPYVYPAITFRIAGEGIR